MSAGLDAATLDWFAAKYNGFADRADTLGTAQVFRTAANLAAAEASQIRAFADVSGGAL